MTISKHAEVFAGRPVRPYESGKKPKPGAVYRLALDYDSKVTFPDLLDQFLADNAGSPIDALVIGSWGGDSMADASEAVQALVGSRDRLPGLKSLYLGDITFEECEMSWIRLGDISELLPAFPGLEELRLRGTSELELGSLKHAGLKSFAIESGGLASTLIESVLAAHFPSLTHLELWLGEEGYGGIDTPEVLGPLLGGTPFPKLTHLGLRNSRIADEVAVAVSQSEIVKRLETLDLSLGNIGDVGAGALLACPAVKKLKKLDLHHHYISETLVEELNALGIEIDLSDPMGAETDEEDRYITVGE